MRMHDSQTSPIRASAHRDARLLIAFDAGKVTTSLAWGRRGPDGALVVEGTRAERHEGEPLGPFFSLYAELGHRPCSAWSPRAPSPSGWRRPSRRRAGRGRAGARGGVLWPPRAAERGASRRQRVSALTRDAEARRLRDERPLLGRRGRERRAVCAPASARLWTRPWPWPRRSDEVIAVTARCAVFAKSELTHFANQGEPHGKLFRGLFESVAANLHGLFDKIKVAGPPSSVGHGALIRPIVEEFARLVAATSRSPAEAPVFEALGALRYAARRTNGRPAQLAGPTRPKLARPPRRRMSSSPAAGEGPGEVVAARRSPTPAEAEPGADGRRRAPAPSSASIWVRPGPRRRWWSWAAAACWPTSTGAPTATRSRPRRPWSPSCGR